MTALESVLERQFALAALRLRLDEELGTLHGLAWDDFVLLAAVEAAERPPTTRSLARRLGLTPSALVLRLLPLEKTGLVERTPAREVVLRGPGRRLLEEARETAQAICAT
jgi:DNA-binding MarR family transcriptional regulator